MNYSTIKYFDIANGEGVRTTLFVSGCRRGCPGCFNTEAWDFSAGKPFTREIEDKIIESLSASYVDGLTLLGGEPMEPENQTGLLPFLQRVRSRFPEKTIWCYTGYKFENLQKNPQQLALLQQIDVLVDGPFIEALRDKDLFFRGSSNQRIINVRKSLESGKVVELNLTTDNPNPQL